MLFYKKNKKFHNLNRICSTKVQNSFLFQIFFIAFQLCLICPNIVTWTISTIERFISFMVMLIWIMNFQKLFTFQGQVWKSGTADRRCLCIWMNWICYWSFSFSHFNIALINYRDTIRDGNELLTNRGR